MPAPDPAKSEKPGLRILFVLPRMVSGGVERITLTLAAHFLAAGHDCHLALRHGHGELLAEAQGLLPVSELAPAGMQQFIPALVRLLRDYRPSHVITAFSDVAALTWVALRLAGSPAVLVHGVHNTHAPVIARPGAAGRLGHWLGNRFAGFVYRHADAVVAVSEGVRQEVLSDFRISPGRVVTIYNPVLRDDQLVEEERPAPSGDLAMITVGRLARQKGLDILVEALAMARLELPWHMDIWGEGPEREKLEAQIRRHGLEARVTLRGYCATPLATMRTADVYLLPSRHEGLPTALIEALASGPQIIAADCPHGPREILEQGRLGMLVPPEDPVALATAIERMARGEGLVPRAAQLQRARDFSATAAASHWLSLLRQVQRD